MSDNIEKALYSGVALLMLIAALTSFFYYYAQYEGFINRATQQMSGHVMVNQKLDDAFFTTTGNEVLHQVLEIKNREKTCVISRNYDAELASGPEIFVNGQAHDRVDISGIDFSKSYRVDYEISPQGVVTAIYFTSE
ncbi:MAG: hypothetical protein GX184_05725 [Clostridiaceae bacterium]|nr:hypothetical protein [Clostridiaceae bacterium]